MYYFVGWAHTLIRPIVQNVAVSIDIAVFMVVTAHINCASIASAIIADRAFTLIVVFAVSSWVLILAHSNRHLAVRIFLFLVQNRRCVVYAQSVSEKILHFLLMSVPSYVWRVSSIHANSFDSRSNSQKYGSAVIGAVLMSKQRPPLKVFVGAFPSWMKHILWESGWSSQVSCGHLMPWVRTL